MGITQYPSVAQARVDTFSGWSSLNPILARGQSGYEIDSGKLKIGDGISNWEDLDYVTSPDIIETSFLTMGA
jgi:hypothetical protein